MADPPRVRLAGRPITALALLAGVAAVLVAMASGVAPGLLDGIARPVPIVRAVLAGASMVVGARLLLIALRRIDQSVSRPIDPESVPADRPVVTTADLGLLVRGVRLVFLAAAAFAAASGWILGESLPIVVALVIAGVDVVETSFLLLMAARPGDR
jgi:hypothetical protein